MYQIIYDFLLSLFPTQITEQCLAWVNLASITTITLLYVAGVLFVIAVVKFVGGLFIK